MRDCSKNRAGYDRVLMTAAAAFLTVAASPALAQGNNPPRSSAAELAIDAAVPHPEPANVPPPGPGDFKLDTAVAPSSAAEATTTTALDTAAANSEPTKIESGKTEETAAPDAPKIEAPKADTATADIVKPDIAKSDMAKDDAANVAPAVTPSAPDEAKEPVKTAGSVAPTDQPVADRLRDLLGVRSARYFDRKTERVAVEKFYTARDYAPIWAQGGKLTDSGKSVIARLKDAASDGLNPSDYPVPDFALATTPDALAEADLKLTSSMLDYARHAQSGRMHWSQLSGDIQYPEHPTDPTEVLTNITSAKDASLALDSYNPPHKLYRELKKKLAELRGQGDGPAAEIADGPVLKFTPARGKNQSAIEMEDERVPQLRAKLNIAENPDDRHYDAKVAEAVRRFQAQADLRPTGVLDETTVRAINSPKRDRQIDTVMPMSFSTFPITRSRSCSMASRSGPRVWWPASPAFMPPRF
jgi:murein L,D-transpeptidase YcbB/YkuD